VIPPARRGFPASLQRSAAQSTIEDLKVADKITTMTKDRTNYATIADAEADGWRRICKSDKDVSGGNSFGYDFISANGKRSQTITFSQETNRMGAFGCCMEMFKD
jgi:hypothetical protein